MRPSMHVPQRSQQLPRAPVYPPRLCQSMAGIMSGVGGHGPSPSHAWADQTPVCSASRRPLGYVPNNRSITSPNINAAVHARAAAQPAITPRAGISAPPLPKRVSCPAWAGTALVHPTPQLLKRLPVTVVKPAFKHVSAMQRVGSF